MGAWTTVEGWQMVGTVALIALLVAAAWVDVREHRIPNALVFPGIALGLMFAHLPGGSVGGAALGVAVGMAMGLPLYALRAMGAGDVKLMGMAGAFLGAGDMFVAGLVIFVVGGVLGLVAVWRRRAFRQLGANLKDMAGGLTARLAGGPAAAGAAAPSVGVLPYGVAIAAGTILYLAAVKGGVFA
jgi:prepilin peptidase CpaA